MMPSGEFVSQVVCRVGSGESPDTLRQVLESNPFSYLHVVKPGIHFGESAENREKHYRFAKSYFGQMAEQNVLQQVGPPAIYIYRQQFSDGHIFEGLVAGISVIDYMEGTIKKHEYTLTEKEARMAEHITNTGVVGEPVLLANPEEDYTADWIRRHKKGEPCLQFADELNIDHTIWNITDPEAISEIQHCFRQTQALYIADGHHRIAASSLYLTHMHNEQNWPATKLTFMAYVLPESSLWINPFHRVVKGIGDAAVAQILVEAASKFLIERVEAPVNPEVKGQFGVYTRQGWFRFSFLEDADYHTPAENLDVFRLEKYVFDNILHIKDSKSDNRLSFLRGDMDVKELQVLVDSGAADIAFVLYPNTMAEIKEVADAGQTMPPKSTWIEPKLLTGMIIQKF
jgi:uncharacterized protein (DUF1015 family)